MSTDSSLRWWLRLGVWAVVAGVPAGLWAGDSIKGVGKVNPEDETVEVFAAIGRGQLEATLIPRDASQACLLLRNKTDKPLNVQLPSVMAGVPVLAQFAPPGQANADANDSPQPLGLINSMNNMNRGNNRNGQNRQGPAMPPFFNIAPEKTAQVKLVGLCLEHDRSAPKPKIAYQLQPLDRVTDKPGVYELCAMVARGEVSQQAAQAAAWHLNNSLSWKQLKAKRTRFGAVQLPEAYFTTRELAEGEKAASKALELARAGRTASSASLSAK